ncbi:hypothetical protein HGM15179_021005 [Zosterops borbonicus]|uniref:Reverse transcriptase domain-containing protein n=1 Tax=Zosterops borbonicus TaxID=364589 RepID=A0A8K1D6Q3_9PASS|nr:hypothetical protein HGM15179_021005 [Zosterops borbonicus]
MVQPMEVHGGAEIQLQPVEHTTPEQVALALRFNVSQSIQITFAAMTITRSYFPEGKSRHSNHYAKFVKTETGEHETTTPTYKKVWKEDSGNYRPVSLTLVPRKIMEEIIASAITWHIQDNQGNRPSQHGFRKGRSCLTNLISFYDHVIHLVDEGKTMDVVYLDFTKAFDTVSCRILLKKLKLIAWTVCWVTQNHRITRLEETFKIIKSNPCPYTSTKPWHRVPHPIFF